jgi:hypothetical protein
MTSRKDNLRRARKLSKMSREERVAVLLQKGYDDMDNDEFVTLVRIVVMIIEAELRLIVWQGEL